MNNNNNNNNNSSPVAARPIEFSGPAEPQENAWASFGFVWRRLWLVLVAVVVGLGLGYLYFLKETPVYQSVAQMLIVKQRPTMPIVGIAGIQPEAQYDLTHETLLRSSLIINQAVKKHDLDKLPSLRASGNPVGQIILGLKVEGIVGESGDVIKFSYSSANPEECPKVLEAVIAEYRTFLGETYQNVNEETVELISQAKDVLDRQISESQREYQTFRGEVPLLYLGGRRQERPRRPLAAD